MKKLILSPLILIMMVIIPSCGNLSNISKYVLTEQDAASAIREALLIGVDKGSKILGQHDAFSKDALYAAIFPAELQKVAKTLNSLGLSDELDRFVVNLGTAAEKTAKLSAPIFVDGIRKMSITDAIRIVRTGGTAATDYLRVTVGDTLRKSVDPVMQTALDEYKLAKAWADLVKPAQVVLGGKVNLDLSNLMAGLVTNSMFNKIEEQEIAIRTKAEARTSSLLQRVFGS